MGLYNVILNITEQLVGRKVVRANDESEKPAVGRIVAAGLKTGGRLWVVWPHTNGEPTSHHPRELLALKEDELSKSLKWHGKKLGGLETFIAQVRREGGTAETELNPGSDQHVHIKVSLPLAPADSGYDPRMSEGDPHAEDPRPAHTHDFTEVCAPPCPRSVPYRTVKDNPQA